MQLQHLQLSDAIRLGSLLVDRTEAGNIERCAITMALKAIGDLGTPESLAYLQKQRENFKNKTDKEARWTNEIIALYM